MIGHTKATAGVAGLMKAALALHHRVLPPTIGVSEPNPKADFPASPFYVNTEARPWLTGGAPHPRRAGVSAFGFGGTDFHVVLEEYGGGFLGQPDAAVPRWPAELLMWRGTRAELIAATEELADTARAASEPPSGRCGGARARGEVRLRRARRAPCWRWWSSPAKRSCEKLARCRELLASGAATVHERDGIHFVRASRSPSEGRLAFLFPGQGSQVARHGSRVGDRFPAGARALRAGRPGAGRPLRASACPASCSRPRRWRPRTSARARPRSPTRTSRSRRWVPPSSPGMSVLEHARDQPPDDRRPQLRGVRRARRRGRDRRDPAAGAFRGAGAAS